MAINRGKEQKDGELNLIINNGDLQVLKETVSRLGFLNEESMLRYALAVLSKSATRALTITTQNGENQSLSPSESLVKIEK